jgi:hypothetical protein
MHTFALRRRSCWVARALGRNPLLRPTDRVEACVILVAILLALVAAPVCAAAGVAVYGSRARLYAEQAQTRHTVAATVIEENTHTRPPHHEHFGPSDLAGWRRRAHRLVQDRQGGQSR